MRYNSLYADHKDDDADVNLVNAAKIGDLTGVQRWLGLGANINPPYDVALGKDENSVLYWAIQSKKSNVVRFLVERKTSLETASGKNTALHTAVSIGSVESVRIISDVMTMNDIEAAKDERGFTALHHVAFLTKKEIILEIAELLLNKVSDVNKTDHEGKTTLHYAAFYSNIDLVRLLVGKGVNINVLDESGMSPLHHATWNSNIDMVRLLVDRGANIKALDKSEKSPLHYAAEQGLVDVMEYLLENGAIIDEQVINIFGRSSSSTPERSFQDLLSVMKRLNSPELLQRALSARIERKFPRERAVEQPAQDSTGAIATGEDRGDEDSKSSGVTGSTDGATLAEGRHAARVRPAGRRCSCNWFSGKRYSCNWFSGGKYK